MIDATISTYRESILELLELCMFGDRSKITAELQWYEEDANRLLTGEVQHNALIGIAGFIRTNADHAILLHLSVTPHYQRQGMGSKMIDNLMRSYSIPNLEAETDIEAVDFYRSAGFQITSLGEKYPGVERFRCMLSGKSKGGDRYGR
jgi:ribosomal protein S18 acetylase RimI-like enzyme